MTEITTNTTANKIISTPENPTATANLTPTLSQEADAVINAVQNISKNWVQSKTVWTGIIGLCLILLNIFGYAIPQQLYWIVGFLGLIFLRLGQNVPVSN